MLYPPDNKSNFFNVKIDNFVQFIYFNDENKFGSNVHRVPFGLYNKQLTFLRYLTY